MASETDVPNARAESLREVLEQASRQGWVQLRETEETSQATNPIKIEQNRVSKVPVLACQDVSFLEGLSNPSSQAMELLSRGLVEEILALSLYSDLPESLSILARIISGQATHSDSMALAALEDCGAKLAPFKLLTETDLKAAVPDAASARSIVRGVAELPLWLRRRLGLSIGVKAVHAEHTHLARMMAAMLDESDLLSAPAFSGDQQAVFLLAYIEGMKGRAYAVPRLQWVADRDGPLQIAAMASLEDMSSLDLVLDMDKQDDLPGQLAHLTETALSQGDLNQANLLLAHVPKDASGKISKLRSELIAHFAKDLNGTDPLAQLRAMDALLKIHDAGETTLSDMQADVRKRLAEVSALKDVDVSAPKLALATEKHAQTEQPVQTPRTAEAADRMIEKLESDLAKLTARLSALESGGSGIEGASHE